MISKAWFYILGDLPRSPDTNTQQCFCRSPLILYLYIDESLVLLPFFKLIKDIRMLLFTLIISIIQEWIDSLHFAVLNTLNHFILLFNIDILYLLFHLLDICFSDWNCYILLIYYYIYILDSSLLK